MAALAWLCSDTLADLDLTSLCPFPTAAFAWQPRAGEWNLTVCVKATLALLHGQDAQIAAVQMAIGNDAHWDGNPGASLYAPSDFVPYKPRVDVLLAGHAYAPGGAPVESLAVRLQVGSLVKELTVTGDRVWAQGRGGLLPGQVAPFRHLALRYERGALAGESAIGVDEAAHGVEVGRPLPNIVAASGHTPGFGPVPILWRARRRNLPDAAVLWAYRARLASGVMPQGFDFSLFNVAPAEQQVSALLPHTPIVLDHLSPHLPRLESRLPALAPRLFRVDPDTGRANPVAMRADTLWIDADRSLAVVSWRGLTQVPGPSDAEVGPLIVAVEEGEPIRTEDIERLALTPAVHRGPPKLAVVTSVETASKTAPPSVPPAALVPPAPPSTPRAEPPPSAPRAEPPPSAPSLPVPAAPPSSSFTDLDVTQAVRVGVPLRGALPFRADAAAAPSPRATPSEVVLPQVLPFKSTPPGAPTPPASAPIALESKPKSEAPPVFDENVTQEINVSTLDIAALLAARGRPPELAPRPVSTMLQAPERTPVVPPPPPLGASLFSAAAVDAPAAPAEPPPLLGAPLFEASTSHEAPAIAASPAADRRSLPAIEPGVVAVEVCAAITAEIGEQRAPRDEVIQARGLTVEAWTSAEEHWATAIAAEAKRGGGKLTDAYDTAYVATIESFRGPVTPEEYGRLLQAMKAGKANQALDELRIQRAAMPRLMRVWTKRLAEDPQLLRKVKGTGPK